MKQKKKSVTAIDGTTRAVNLDAALMERCLAHRTAFAVRTGYPVASVKDWIEYLLKTQCDNLDFVQSQSHTPQEVQL